ncbi:hypothetical protein ABPG75_011520 [Micractinium tetrahymenae]
MFPGSAIRSRHTRKNPVGSSKSRRWEQWAEADQRCGQRSPLPEMGHDQQRCSLCSRTFPRQDLRYTPVGGGVRNQYSDYLCRQCWAVLSNGQPWPEQAESAHGSGSPPSGDQHGRPPLDRRQQQQLLQQQQQAAALQQGSPVSMDMLQRSISAPMSGMTAAQAVHYQSALQQHQQQQAAAAAAAQQQQFGSGPSPFGGLLAAAQAPPALGRRSQSFADFQHHSQHQQQGLPIGGGYGQAGRRPWQPASMPEQPVLLGSSDDPRWGNLGSASASDHRRGRPIAGSSRHRMMVSGMGGTSAPVRPGLLSGSMNPRGGFNSVPGGMLDEASLELFESQSHLLDPDSRAALQKQRQMLEWQQGQGSVGDEAHTLATSLERQDSAGSGNEPLEVSSIKRQLRTALSERDSQTQKANELQSQLQDKKRQLFSAIQEREGLRQQVRQLEDKCREFQEALQCKICRAVQRNCVVLPCLHFLYCDSCFKQHCATSPSCPACNCAVTGFQALIMHR